MVKFVFSLKFEENSEIPKMERICVQISNLLRIGLLLRSKGHLGSVWSFGPKILSLKFHFPMACRKGAYFNFYPYKEWYFVNVTVNLALRVQPFGVIFDDLLIVKSILND